jgi:plasmid maintenance system antidote protein VapI
MNPIQHPQRCETCDYFPAGSIFDERCPYSEFTWRHAGNHPQCIKDPFLASEIWQVPIDVMSELTSFIGCASHSSHSTVSGQPPVPGFFTPHYTHDEKMAIRRSIHRGGEQFYKSFSDIDDLQNIAGEFMSLNEDWCVLYPGTYGYEDRINTGFSQNQKHFLERIADKIRSRPVHQQQEQAVKDKVLDECFQPSPPGDTIKDIMEEKDISRSKLGKLLDIRDEQVSKLLSGIYLIDSDMAYRLSVALGSTQDFWEERERQYRIKLREELRQSAKEPVQEGRAPGDER